MSNELVTGLLPVLGSPLDMGFNVFDVMHHGLHEKQISNVFRWLLEAEGTHNLGDRFVTVFIDEVNRSLAEHESLPHDGYWVSQEVNTSIVGDGADIADLVLESNTTVLIVENYFTSDGHGHSYHGYLEYSQRDDRRGVVVLLCRDQDRSLQTLGWENAPVVTYGNLIRRLHEVVRSDLVYQRKNLEAYSFIEQMYSKFVEGRGRMEDENVLDFVIAMCGTGEARRYQEQRQDVAAEQFASDLAEQARQRFGEGRKLLQQVKDRLKNFSGETLLRQLNTTLGDGFVRQISARYAGIYQWTINFDLAHDETDDTNDIGEASLQLKFGPSAWFAIEQDPSWKHTLDPATADYSRIFLTRSPIMEIRQSIVTVQEVLDGLAPADVRLHDEIVQLLSDPQRTNLRRRLHKHD